MNPHLLQSKFESLGARVVVAPADSTVARVSIDIRRDRKGEYFHLALRDNDPAQPLRVDVLDCRPRDRHLLLMVAPDAAGRKVAVAEKQKFLCGHDERAWFVAAVPELAGASNVRTAMEALKPRAADDAQARHRVRFEHRNRRKNPGFVRQGEWFFIPRPDLRVPPELVTRDERMSRGGGSKPHFAEFACRSGGEAVYVDPRTNRVLTTVQYRALLSRNPAAARSLLVQRRNANLVVKGRVRHADHATILLRCWHEVVMNTEHQSQAMRSVAFVD
jgi:hypothetical protein